MQQPSSNEAVYNELIALLHPHTPRTLDLDVLPSSYGTQIQYSDEDAALGIPKSVLIQCFLQARRRFFAADDSLRSGSPPEPTAAVREPINEDEEQYERGGSLKEHHQAKWQAASILILWDPNYNTAVNFRKRLLLTSSSVPPFAVDHVIPNSTDDLVRQELCFLESLLISCMRRHNKSPILFAHRSWLLRTFILPRLFWQNTDSQALKMSIRNIWEREMGIVLLAGGKHLGNYYAWNYARDTLALLQSFPPTDICGDVAVQLTGTVLEGVKKWCFQHPRDVSGWTFLASILDRLRKSKSHLATANGLLEDVSDWKVVMKWEGAAFDVFTYLTGTRHEARQ